jgi:hypothetical protein
VLLRIEKNSGHGGADLVKAEVEKNADRYAFALWATSPHENVASASKSGASAKAAPSGTAAP